MEEQPKNFFSNPVVIIIGVVILLSCCCTLILAAGGVAFYEISNQVGTTMPELNGFDPSTPTSEPIVTRPPTENTSTDTLNTLKTTLVPENDPYDLACRLRGICDVPKTLPAPNPPLKVGDTQKFWIQNSNTNENFQIDATLLNITPHTYFWAENGTDVNKNDMKALMDTFEEEIYPKDREFFGSEWTPGVDNDPHIYVIYAGNIGDTVAGYFSSLDEYNPKVHKYSNGHEAFVLSTSQDLAAEYTYIVLAHEFVHMIQFPSDRNDVAWINEGFAEVGAFLNGYNVGGADQLYVQNPDLQLNDWADPNSPDFSPHYGISFLYLTYFLDRFGEDASKALTANPENDLTSVDDTLKSLNITDPQTGKVVTADDVFMDFATALFLQDKQVGDGRYTYHNYPDAPQTSATETISDCPAVPITRNVHQYGIDYIGIDCTGDHTLHLEGSTVTGLLPVDAHSGKYSFWSNKGDESDITLTREFDFSGVTSPIEMSYYTWYDLEADYDYAYVEASTDGTTWQILNTPSCTSKYPSGNSYGCGYNAKSGGGDTAQWIQEKVDLSPYAGQKVQVRFEYVTDAAINGEGLLLDDVSVPAVNYSTDFENDNGGWEAAGFARVENVLPQTFRLALIVKKSNGETTVTPVTLNSENVADVPLDLQSGDTAVLVVTGTTRFTREPAVYSLEVK